MFDKQHYVPVLKWKRGEQTALENLEIIYKDVTTPLIEIVSKPYDFKNNCFKKTLDEHIKNTAEQIKESWDSEKPVFLDLYWLDLSERLADGSHPLSYILDNARTKGVKIIPVTGTKKDSAYQQEVKIANSKDNLGICIRLEDDDFLDLDEHIKNLLKSLSASPEIVDIIIDLKYVTENDEKKNTLSAINIINSLPHIEKWRTLTLCASAFPENLSSIKANTVASIKRSEWVIWKSIQGLKKEKVKRMPSFGDYVIANPFYDEVDPRIMTMSANIRYTSEDEWYIFRGMSIKKRGFKQYFDLCDQLIKHKVFCGKTHCSGDKFIFECATTKKSTGNAETWRSIASNHHLTFASSQISNYFGF